MTPRASLAILLIAASACAGAAHRNSATSPWTPDRGSRHLSRDLDALLDAPILARALVGVRVDSLKSGRIVYARNNTKLVVPASNLKLLTLAVAAERLGWDHTFETRLEAAGTIAGGTLTGDLIVTGGGDPSIVSPDLGHPALFLEWADALHNAGIDRVDGRIIGDDNTFDDLGLGAGWAWDYLADGYAAPSGALSYNENVVAMRVTPGQAEGDPVTIDLAPPGSAFVVQNDVRTDPAGTAASISVARMPGSDRLIVSGHVPAGGAPLARVTAIGNPTTYFVDALRLAIDSRGIAVRDGSWDIDELTRPVAEGPRAIIARHQSPPLSDLGAQMLKKSQNFYGEMLLKATAASGTQPGSAASGRAAARETLATWGIFPDSFVMNDGSGLSRYDYVTADAIITLLEHVWADEKMRGPFVAALPIAGRDGTLENRMKNTPLEGRVQAKTGTISNVRALSGFLEARSGERLVFSIVVNHFTASSAEIDAVVESILTRLAQR